MLHPIQYGGLTQLYASTMPEAIHHNGGVRMSRFPRDVLVAELT